VTDRARNIWIPRELTMPSQLQVAFNDQEVVFRYRWPAEQPHVVTVGADRGMRCVTPVQSRRGESR